MTPKVGPSSKHQASSFKKCYNRERSGIRFLKIRFTGKSVERTVCCTFDLCNVDDVSYLPAVGSLYACPLNHFNSRYDCDNGVVANCMNSIK